MRISSRSALAFLVVAACSKGDTTADSAAGAVATPAAAPATPAPLSLASVAGDWAVVSKPTEGKDTTSTKLTIHATADTAGWTENHAGRAPLPIHVRVDGDSLMTHAGPYDSFRRKGVKVVTDGVWRMQGGDMTGTVVAHYAVKSADSVLHLQMKGTKKP